MTPYRKTVLIYNPAAGKFRRNGALVQQAVEILKGNGHEVTVEPTTGPRTAGAIARRHAEAGAGLVLAAGGDGVINETAEGLIHTGVPLGILPGGTANVLANEMNLGGNFVGAVEAIERCRPRRIPAGRVTCDGGRVSRFFLLMAGIGLDAHIVYHVSGPLKAKTGKFAYWVAGWSLMGRRLAQFDVEVDGHPYRCSFALLSRVKNYGGDFEIAREVNLLEDRFEVVLFEGRSSARYVKYLAGMVLKKLTGMKGVTVLHAQRARLTCPEDRRVYVQVDGEYAGRLPAEVEIVPDALTLLVPPEYGG